MKKLKCRHYWKVVEVRNIMPNCSVIDLVLECNLCKKIALATAHFDKEEYYK